MFGLSVGSVIFGGLRGLLLLRVRGILENCTLLPPVRWGCLQRTKKTAPGQVKKERECHVVALDRTKGENKYSSQSWQERGEIRKASVPREEHRLAKRSVYTHDLVLLCYNIIFRGDDLTTPKNVFLTEAFSPHPHATLAAIPERACLVRPRFAKIYQAIKLRRSPMTGKGAQISFSTIANERIFASLILGLDAEA